MTAYFDKAQTIARQALEEGSYDWLAGVEKEVAADVTAITGDREFPEEDRERMLGIIATQASYPLWDGDDRTEFRRRLTGYSRLIEGLHDAWHDLARKRVRTRFGLLRDDPAQARVLRDEHDARGSDPREDD